MSVSQVKKRFGEIESYLGRDKEALRRLKLLKDDVNVLRTSLAAAEEKAEQAEIVKDAARERADKAEFELNAASIEIHRLQQQVQSLTAKINSTSIENSLESEDEIEPADGINKTTNEQLKSVIKHLRKKMKFCPKATQYATLLPEKSPVFNKEDLVEGWSHDSIWILGASVAMVSFLLGTVTVESSERSKDRMDADGSPFANHLMDWFMKNNVEKPSREMIRREVKLNMPVKFHQFLG